MSKQSRRERGRLYAEYKKGRENRNTFPGYTQKKLKHYTELAIKGKDSKTMKKATRKAAIYADSYNALAQWRTKKGETKPWGVRYGNSLERPRKGYLIRSIYDLQKKGQLDLKKLGLEINAQTYNDVVDWALEDMSDDQLIDIIAEAESSYEGPRDYDFITGKLI